MQFTIISYNLKFHNAYPEVPGLVAAYKPDIVCLQECYASQLEPTLGNLTLATKTSIGKLGMAIYVNAKRFKVAAIHEVPLPLSRVERILRKKRTRLLIAELHEKKHKLPVLVGSFHATELVAPNALRYMQVSLALQKLRSINDAAPAILIGDYNHPFPKQKLRKQIAQAGFELIATIEPTYSGRRVRFVLDFASIRRLTSTRLQVLPFSSSDHAPILATLKTKD